MQFNTFKKINIEVLLKLIILIGFSFFFYDLIKTGKVLLYVNPRIIPYVKFAILTMIALSLFVSRDLFKAKRKVNIKPYLFFIIPLFMAFLTPTTSVSSKSMALTRSKSTAQIESQQGNNSEEIKTNQEKPKDSTVTENANSSKEDLELEMQNNVIVVNDNSFIKWTQEITYNMLKYEGKKIELTGFVFKDEHFKENEFVPARLMMSCCAADLQPVGLLCNYDKAKELNQDSWVIVTGKIKILDYNGEKTPVIIADTIKNTEKPKNEYVYPF